MTQKELKALKAIARRNKRNGSFGKRLHQLVTRYASGEIKYEIDRGGIVVYDTSTGDDVFMQGDDIYMFAEAIGFRGDAFDNQEEAMDYLMDHEGEAFDDPGYF